MGIEAHEASGCHPLPELADTDCPNRRYISTNVKLGPRFGNILFTRFTLTKHTDYITVRLSGKTGNIPPTLSWVLRQGVFGVIGTKKREWLQRLDTGTVAAPEVGGFGPDGVTPPVVFRELLKASLRKLPDCPDAEAAVLEG